MRTWTCRGAQKKDGPREKVAVVDGEAVFVLVLVALCFGPVVVNLAKASVHVLVELFSCAFMRQSITHTIGRHTHIFELHGKQRARFRDLLCARACVTRTLLFIK